MWLISGAVEFLHGFGIGPAGILTTLLLVLATSSSIVKMRIHTIRRQSDTVWRPVTRTGVNRSAVSRRRCFSTTPDCDATSP